ncbi:MAG: S41 family peptidase [Candidatus Acidiferrales bacterium]
MSRLGKSVVVTLSIIVFGYAGLGYLLGKSDDDKTYRSLTVYGEVLQHIQEDYVDEPNLPVVTAGSLHGLLESLDAQSAYLSPREYSDYRDRTKGGTHASTGLTLSKRYGYIIVVSELPGGPGEKAGLRSGDILEEVGGFATRDMSVPQAYLLLDGAPGTTVKVDVVRRGATEPQQIEVTRAVTDVPHLTADKVSDDTAYVRLPTLDAGTAAELSAKLVQLQHQGAQKLVLDLRDCSTGPDSEGVAAAQLFLSSGEIGSLGGQTVEKQVFDAAPDKVVWHGPVEVLISDSTSGAAEVLAAAIGENKRGDLVGERTFGSASEQKEIPLDDGAGLILTVAYYYAPDGKAIIEDGVPATVEVAPPTDQSDENVETPAPLAAGQLPAKDDAVFSKALDLLKAGTAPAGSAAPQKAS